VYRWPELVRRSVTEIRWSRIRRADRECFTECWSRVAVNDSSSASLAAAAAVAMVTELTERTQVVVISRYTLLPSVRCTLPLYTCSSPV